MCNLEGNAIALNRCGNDRLTGNQRHLLGFWKPGGVREYSQIKERGGSPAA